VSPIKESSGRVEIAADSAALAHAATGHFVGLAEAAIAARGRFLVALSGGSPPRAAYALLATPGCAARVRWAQVHIFWADERCVPPDSPDSNYRLARETLLDRVPIPAGHVHRLAGERPPAEAAARYERTLRDVFVPPGEGDADRDLPPPRFDLIVLGLGADGHTASLFPGTLALRERQRWVVANYVEKLQAWRLTLTLPVLNAAANVIFLVSGKEKAERLKHVLEDPLRPEVPPAAMVNPSAGNLLWLVDAAAASLLHR
jgi:6-phosphogluconolactonase